MAPKIAIILVNWNNFSESAACLDSLRKIDYVNYQVILVDNGSAVSIKDRMADEYPEVVFIDNGCNNGLTGGNNAGSRYALTHAADYCLLLNNDTTVDPGILRAFVDVAERNPTAGIFGAKIYYYADPRRIWWATSHWDSGQRRFVNQGCNVLDDGGVFNAVTTQDYANGCALFYRADVARAIGLMDERFFLYYEDVDWCFTAKSKGYDILFVPQARVWHKVATTSGGSSSPVIHYFETRNQFLWARKHLPRSLRRLFFLRQLRDFFPATVSPEPVFCLKRFYRDAVFLRSPRGQAKICGLRDYLRGRFGNCPAGVRALGKTTQELKNNVL